VGGRPNGHAAQSDQEMPEQMFVEEEEEEFWVQCLLNEISLRVPVGYEVHGTAERDREGIVQFAYVVVQSLDGEDLPLTYGLKEFMTGAVDTILNECFEWTPWLQGIIYSGTYRD
jgi:hypothetical protein